MFGTLKKVVKVGVVCTVLVAAFGVAAVALAGESRARAVAREVHGAVLETIDEHIEDPAALRSQLRDMEREYPGKIAQVRGDLAELRQEIRDLERERAISQRVVELVQNDLGSLALASDGGADERGLSPRTFEIGGASADRRSDGERLELQRQLYQSRVADADHNLVYLRHQEGRLDGLLTKLEAERAEFQGQIAGLACQIDAIARNDRLIELLEKRNRTIEECSRYEGGSLDQITSRLAMIRTRQEAELELLVASETGTDYEHQARMQITAEELDGVVGGAVDDAAGKSGAPLQNRTAGSR